MRSLELIRLVLPINLDCITQSLGGHQKTRMYLPTHNKIERTGFSGNSWPFLILWLVVSMLLLANGCASRNDMEFHPKTITDKSNSKRMSGTTPAAHSNTNLSISTNLTSNASSGDTRFSVTNDNRVITLSDPWAGKVAFVNPEARFVILDYSLSQMPPMGQRLSVFRKGVRVGEVKISGQPQTGYVAADITTGEIRIGDETRRD